MEAIIEVCQDEMDTGKEQIKTEITATSTGQDDLKLPLVPTKNR
jgi:hypothetical protein